MSPLKITFFVACLPCALSLRLTDTEPSCLAARACEGTFQYVEPRENIMMEKTSSQEECVKTWEENATLVGNHQKPRSSNREDVMIYERFFSAGQPLYKTVTGANHGVFLEMGAFDGIAESNSLFYERCLGWRGLLIEANPIPFKELIANRPLAHKLNMAPSCLDDHSTIKFVSHQYTSAGEYDVLPDADKATLNKESLLDVHCGPLSLYLDKLGITKIDFWSLDVEGAELEVLKTFDFDKVQVGVLMVESFNRQCQEHCPKRDAVRDLLQSRGAELIEGFVHNSDVFVWQH